jgi:hypothetical protein
MVQDSKHAFDYSSFQSIWFKTFKLFGYITLLVLMGKKNQNLGMCY